MIDFNSVIKPSSLWDISVKLFYKFMASFSVSSFSSTSLIFLQSPFLLSQMFIKAHILLLISLHCLFRYNSLSFVVLSLNSTLYWTNFAVSLWHFFTFLQLFSTCQQTDILPPLALGDRCACFIFNNVMNFSPEFSRSSIYLIVPIKYSYFHCIIIWILPCIFLVWWFNLLSFV